MFCGWKTNAEGRLQREYQLDEDTGTSALRKVPVCSADCGSAINPLTQDIQRSHMTSSGAEAVSASLEASESGEVLGTVSIQSGALQGAGGSASEAVTLAIQSAPLEDVRSGSYANLDVLSTCVELIPGSVPDINVLEGIDLDLCVSNPDAQNDAALCEKVLSRLRPYSSNDLVTDDATEVVGGCTKGDACGCSCKFKTRHLTAFAVVDTGIEREGEESVDQLAATGLEAPPPAPPSSGGGSSPVVPIVCALLGVGVIAAAAVVRKRRQGGKYDARASNMSTKSAQSTTSQNSNRTSQNPMYDGGDVTQAAGAESSEESSVL
jgi:hypothetical protein